MDQQNRPLWVNYLYYGSLFAILLVLSISSIYSREDLVYSRLFFLFYSIGEAMLEMLLFIAAGWLIRTYLHRIFFGLFIAFTFTCALIHLIDFLLNRLVNQSLWDAAACIFDDSFENFLSMLDATGMPFWLWGIIFATFALVPLLGLLIFHTTEWVASKRPFGCSLEKFLQVCFCLPIALFFWDFSASRLVHREAHHALVRTLPWKITFLRPNIPSLSLSTALPAPATEKETLYALESAPILAGKKPNIYLFVVESLREDVINEEIAPHLSAFREKSLHATYGLSNTNCSATAWFDIFHSEFPFYWNCIRQQKRSVAAPGLALLRKMGYKIHVYSSANLGYYDMNQVLFGKNLDGVDSFQPFLHPPPQEAWASDEKTLVAFERDLREKPELKEGQCFIFFWDATHFEYSWPKEKPPRFKPIASEMHYFTTYASKKTITAIKNCYKNSVHFVDGLFGRFLAETPDVENSIVVFTGDHGEEFFEHGHLFHLTELNDVQTQVPIYFQLPKKPAEPPLLATHLDIFPTILDALAPGTSLSLLKGESLLAPKKWPYAVMARYNASRTPCEIALHNGKHKIVARFSNKTDILQSDRLHILSVRTAQEDLVQECRHDLEGWIEQEFGEGLSRLFQK